MKARLFNLDHLTQISISGPDAEKFLQGQVTCDIRVATDQKSLSGAICDPKGRMIVSFLLWRTGNAFHLLLPQSLCEKTMAHLRKYIVFAKVDLSENRQKHYEYLGPPLSSQALISTPRQSFLLIGEPHNIPSSLSHSSETDWHAFNIETGFVWIYPGSSSLFIPQMINLQKWGGIGFKKGCYVGQEIIARTENLGQLKRHLYRARVNADTINIGDELKNKDVPVGNIAETAKGTSGFEVLAVIHHTATENDDGIFLSKNRLFDITGLFS